MRDWQIRKVKKKSFGSFWRVFEGMILSEAFGHFPERARRYFLKEKYSRPVLRDWCRRKDRLVLGAWLGEEIVGFLVAGMDHGGVSFMNWIGVLPEFQGKALGKALVEKWQEIVKKRACHKLVVHTAEKENLGFYQNLGFKLEGTRPNDRYGLTFYVFGKVLG